MRNANKFRESLYRWARYGGCRDYPLLDRWAFEGAIAILENGWTEDFVRGWLERSNTHAKAWKEANGE